MHDALDGDAAFRLEMVTDDELLGHSCGDGAVGQEHLVAGQVDKRRVGHEGRLADEFFHHQQGHDGLEVAFASGRDAFVVQQGEGQATRGLQALDEREAGKGKGVQFFFFTYAADGLVQAHGPQQFSGVAS